MDVTPRVFPCRARLVMAWVMVARWWGEESRESSILLGGQTRTEVKECAAFNYKICCSFPKELIQSRILVELPDQ